MAELNGAQGERGRHWWLLLSGPLTLADAAMRPSATLNSIIDGFAAG